MSKLPKIVLHCYRSAISRRIYVCKSICAPIECQPCLLWHVSCMHDHLSTFKPLNLKFVKRFSEDFIYQNQDLSNPLLQVLESNIGASGHSTKPLPACPRLKWASPQPLNRTSPSNLYKSQKLLSLNVESPLLPVFHRQVGLNSYDYIQQLIMYPST